MINKYILKYCYDLRMLWVSRETLADDRPWRQERSSGPASVGCDGMSCGRRPMAERKGMEWQLRVGLEEDARGNRGGRRIPW